MIFGGMESKVWVILILYVKIVSKKLLYNPWTLGPQNS
jgi:hypothetical protein